ncbi:MAG: aspartate ammonia-lyase [Deltaproteobacteria bacterium]|nr:aspartate ammonia-lyase [Deltaproteobacteria bacterium]
MRSRVEEDLLGKAFLPQESLYGIHTLRALENFPITRKPPHPSLIEAYGDVKLACARTNCDLGVWRDDPHKAQAIQRACMEMAQGLLNEHVLVDCLQGGAGTSTNMNVNEVLANRSLELLGTEHGRYDRVSPLDDINLHQSTNDTYPTALRIAAIRRLRTLEACLVVLQEAFQDLERRFAHVVKVGRTQLQDAVLTTLGRSMGAYAEAFGRDRWRICKCQERLRVVNLGGTAIGTGLGAPRDFIFRVTEALRSITGIGLARAENLLEATQNADIFVEVSGILKACAANLLKVSTDLRLMASGPETGLAEIRLPQRQAGSSIMPGKINPVIPEAVSQAAMMVFGHDAVLTLACASGNLELNPFLPLIALCLLESIDLLAAACDILNRHCAAGIEADEDRCRRHAANSTATATALLPALGYDTVCRIVTAARDQGKTVKEVVLEGGFLTEKAFEQLIGAEAVCRLGSPTLLGGSLR